MPLTKNVKRKNQYQSWDVPTDAAQGDILDVFVSLGNRPANSVTFRNNSLSDAIIQFNVSQSVFGEPSNVRESWVGLGQGGPRPLPLLLDEVQITRPGITIYADEVMSWSINEIAIKDIYLQTVTSGLNILVA